MTEHPEKILAQHVLENAEKFEWSLQGLGMLRTYLPNNSRLHVWDSRYKIKNVSTIHDHPWYLYSCILAGEVTNIRYEVSHSYNENYMCQKIVCGEGGGPNGPSYPVCLDKVKEYRYSQSSRSTYSQSPSNIHESDPSDGAVTLLQRSVHDEANKDLAHVFWPIGEEWVSAEPRPATEKEISDIINNSLEMYFYG